ncbi:hypothetical protein DJ533_00385 (plasmid) [Acinetobacter defluvii]|uniref:XRE family transcriptional regulator n=1 Tax=Acinetobacter defluvii TaxID=1871111 RepID=A0A2S2F8M7_9GAMM|nr:hypothetical protein [Acinetobacter defluvii]AWL27175.1 hypothetical protein DJ533_00385 [Acinetobacter defluvii]
MLTVINFTDQQRIELLERFPIDETVKKYPNSVIDKILRLNIAIGLYFKNQTEAAIYLEVKQPSICKYLKGQLPLPLHRAEKLEEISKKSVLAQDICFTLDEVK